VRSLEAEVSIATSTPSSSTSVWRVVAVAIVASLVGAGVVVVARRSDASRQESRWLSLHSAAIGVTRVRDDRSCRLRFEHTQTPEAGAAQPVCHTVVTCERRLYSGVTDCGDHQHLRDRLSEEHDGDGRIEVDLVAGTMTLDGEAFRF